MRLLPATSAMQHSKIIVALAVAASSKAGSTQYMLACPCLHTGEQRALQAAGLQSHPATPRLAVELEMFQANFLSLTSAQQSLHVVPHANAKPNHPCLLLHALSVHH